MASPSDRLINVWRNVNTDWLPFADVASADVPLSRLFRLTLFQLSVGMVQTLFVGTLNRVMILELKVPASLVAIMLAIPLLVAPFRALVGFKSDTHKSILGWKRVPYLWLGTQMQFGGLAIMPFALIILSGDTHGSVLVGHIGAALAFLLIGAGFHTTQTTGLALAADLAPAASRPRVVALMYMMLLLGVVIAALAFGALLTHFAELRLIQVIQGSAVLTMALNGIALWKQEARTPNRSDAPRPAFRDAWRAFGTHERVPRFLTSVGIGTAAFSMQDILLEPYGGQVLGLSVSATTQLTGLLAAGCLGAFAIAARALARGTDPHRLAAFGATLGLAAFAAVTFAAPLGSPLLFRIGTTLIGLGGGLFSVSTLTAAMNLDRGGLGLALGAWGAVQACAAGGSIALSGALRDAVGGLAARGALGPALTGPAVGYDIVYTLELLLLFVTLICIGPLVRPAAALPATGQRAFGLAEFPS